ncbi:MAG TPA: hypothetical protein PKM17_08990 [Syntrophorhabdus sp.]|nr:hypothetical protein [Syntrophorhabdus sp.]
MEIYCLQLGMLTKFDYCVSMNEGLPCRNLIGCWGDRTDVVAFLNKTLTEDELRKTFSGLPKSKIDRIVDIIKSLKKED